jgi:predicted lipoprotein with Yx(FWY)xxD motif
MSDPSATRRPVRLTGIAGLAIVVVAALVACSSGATTPPSVATQPTVSPVALASGTASASPSTGTASGSPSTASPSASSGPGRYGTGDATPTPKPTSQPTPKASAKPTPKPVSIVVKSASTGVGKVLVGPNGMTLYTRKTDPANGSGCSGSCADSWPPFLVKTGTTVKGASGMSGTFGTFARSGKRQVTYQGRALYYFAGDSYVGDTNGQGAGNVWYVAKP